MTADGDIESSQEDLSTKPKELRQAPIVSLSFDLKTKMPLKKSLISPMVASISISKKEVRKQAEMSSKKFFSAGHSLHQRSQRRNSAEEQVNAVDSYQSSFKGEGEQMTNIILHEASMPNYLN